MLNRLGLATAVVVAFYLLVTLMRGEPETATDATKDYMPTSTQSSSMNDIMNDKMNDKKAVEMETHKLLAELRTIPVSEYAANLAKYERLLELHPGDATFVRKVAFYSQKLTERNSIAGY
ncbi:MAG: hypothetical protein L7U45_03130 [Alphaproteobacteria bacterium]|nr:hypothetical protein [Alphaproteobacteria bacterium]